MASAFMGLRDPLLQAALSHPVLYYAIAAYLGALAGGFATVSSWRLKRLVRTDDGPGAGRRELMSDLTALSYPASNCPSCGKTLSWAEKAPLVGYALCRGRCRGCGMAIPLRYPLIEFAVMATVVLAAAPYRTALNAPLHPIFAFLSAIALCIAIHRPGTGAALAAMEGLAWSALLMIDLVDGSPRQTLLMATCSVTLAIAHRTARNTPRNHDLDWIATVATALSGFLWMGPGPSLAGVAVAMTVAAIRDSRLSTPWRPDNAGAEIIGAALAAIATALSSPLLDAVRLA